MRRGGDAWNVKIFNQAYGDRLAGKGCAADDDPEDGRGLKESQKG